MYGWAGVPRSTHETPGKDVGATQGLPGLTRPEPPHPPGQGPGSPPPGPQTPVRATRRPRRPCFRSQTGPSDHASSATTSPARTHGRPSGQLPGKGNQSCWSPQTLSMRVGERQRPEQEQEAQARPQGEVAGGSEPRLDVYREMSEWEWVARRPRLHSALCLPRTGAP